MRHFCVLTLVLLTALPVARLSAAAAKWVHLTSAHFDMYTSESEGDAKALLAHLEATRAYFLTATHYHDPGGNPVRIVDFKSDSDYAKYKPQEIRTARVYGQAAGPGPATVVAQGIKPDMYDQVFREYTQLVLDDSAPGLPYWFRAGLSMVYSTLKPGDAGMNLGAPPRNSFRGGAVADVDLIFLFTINRDAFLASREHGAADFYDAKSSMGATNGQQATSNPRDPNGSAANTLNGLQSSLGQTQDFAHSAWALVHMLMFQQDYRGPHFGEFMRAMAAGEETGAALNKVYGRPASRIALDLATYAKQTGLMVVTAPFKFDKPAAPEVKPATKEEQDKVFADLAKR